MSDVKPTVGLRYGGLVRVSTETQEKRGESLRTQRTEITEDVELLGGRVVEWYGGQEHATEGWERAEVDRLIRDAARGKFDAVIFANADRWSRDNAKSQEGLNAFKKHRIRFFVGVTEYDLFSPEHLLFLEMSAVIGKFLAANSKRKSILSRIHRAKRLAAPTCGMKPYGRIWDPKTEKWAVDEAKKDAVADAAKRYVAGESLLDLAPVVGVTRDCLRKPVTEYAGPVWVQEFKAEDLDIVERVETPVPELLDEELRKAVLERAGRNKTYHPAKGGRKYLLSGMVVCQHCGMAMFGDGHEGTLYYKHPRPKRAKEYNKEWKCPDPWARVNCGGLEDAVIGQLYALFQNPVGLEKAISAAAPSPSAGEDAKKAGERAQKGLQALLEAKERVVDAIADGTLSKELARKKLADLEAKEAPLRKEVERAHREVALVPEAGEIRQLAQELAGRFKYVEMGEWARRSKVREVEDLGVDGMSFEDKRGLLERVLVGKDADGKRLGVWVERLEGASWKFRIVGKVGLDSTGTSTSPPSPRSTRATAPSTTWAASAT
jgi:DNA invertase Pin-like site-specific DNA recombinase